MSIAMSVFAFVATVPLWLEDELDPNTISPGYGGFIATGAVAVVVVVLGILMVRTVRRINYRAQVQAEIEREKAAAAQEHKHPEAE